MLWWQKMKNRRRQSLGASIGRNQAVWAAVPHGGVGCQPPAVANHRRVARVEPARVDDESRQAAAGLVRLIDVEAQHRAVVHPLAFGVGVGAAVEHAD